MLKNFAEIIGYEDVKLEIERICDILNNPDKYQTLNIVQPNALLLYGDPGTGKTEIAKCIVKELNRKVFICRKDKPDGEFVNYIKQIFEDAKEYQKSNKKCCILLDDFDRYSNTDSRHQNAEEYITIQSCMDDIKDSDIFIIGTANNLECIPDSLLRAGRFGLRIEIENPRGETAEKIVKHFLGKLPYMSDVDTRLIARILDGNSCAQLQEVVNQAGIYAGFAGKQTIDMDDMIRACMRHLYNAPESIEENKNPYLMHVCYHEAAHCLVQEHFEPGSVNLISICRCSGERPGGLTSYCQDPYYFYNKEAMETRVMALLAGKAATEIVYGIHDVGCNSDIGRAINIVERFVDNYACTGFTSWEGVCKESSNELLSRKEILVTNEIEKYYQKAKTILIENREKLDRLAQALFKRKTLIQTDIGQLLT